MINIFILRYEYLWHKYFEREIHLGNCWECGAHGETDEYLKCFKCWYMEKIK
jgi:hypothetical protein